MPREQKGHRGSGSSRSTVHEMDFSVMEEETIREWKGLLAPLFGGSEDSEDVENVVRTEEESYFLVKHDGIFYMVRLEGDTPVLVSWEEVQSGMPRLRKWCAEYFD